jgi:NAD(P)-dependent dehydrogenase (short-subunit alcohol dehydrogenase family)
MSFAQERFSAGTALVTGGAAGIGEGLVRHLADLGMTVVIADVDGERAVELAGDITASGGSAYPYTVDVTDARAVDRMAEEVFNRHGSLELLINNAGIETAGLIWEIDVDRWKRLMDINLHGVFYCVRSFVPRMIQAGRPTCIANLSSVGGLNSVAVQAPYIVSKHAVQALTECLYQDLSLIDVPIQVSAVVPHSIRSQIFLTAQRDAPSTNEIANAVFASMQRDNEETGLDAVSAAEYMVERLARGDFWVFSDDDICAQSAARRATQLSQLSPPADPQVMLDRMGVRQSNVGA